MNLRRNKSLVILFYFASIYFLIPFALADTYEIKIESGNDIIWEFTEVNETLMAQLELDEGYSFNDEIEEGFQVEWDIDDISSYSGVDTDYWDIGYYYSEGADLLEDTEEGEYNTVSVAEDPKALADDWFDGDSIFEFTIVLLPTDIEDYLEEFTAEDTSGVYTSNGKTLTINHTVEGDHDTLVIKYNEDGIQEKYQIYYDDALAYEYELDDVYGEDVDVIMIVIIVIIVIAVFAGIVVLVVVAKYNVKQKTTPPITVQRMPSDTSPAQITPPSSSVYTSAPTAPSTQAVHVVGYCEYCGAEKESDAVFCHSCGQKF